MLAWLHEPGARAPVISIELTVANLSTPFVV
jgi:hypothetical protein